MKVVFCEKQVLEFSIILHEVFTKADYIINTETAGTFPMTILQCKKKTNLSHSLPV